MHDPHPPTAAVRRREEALRSIAIAYPGTREEFPWGHRAIKVAKKSFVFISADGDGLSMSVKLKALHAHALDQTYATPTGYGLGKSGWVTATFAPHEEPPLEELRAWIDESFSLIAPKTLVKSLRAASAKAEATTAKPVRKKSATKPAARTPARKKAARKRTTGKA